MQNKQKYKKFAHKIEHIVVDKFPGFFYKFRIPKAWDYSNYQKNQIIQGLKYCTPDDVIIFSDLDEIPRADKVREYQGRKGTIVFKQKYYNYFLNCVAIDSNSAAHLFKKDSHIYWRGSVMLKYSDFVNAKHTRLQRDKQGDNIIQVENGGLHFSFLCGWEMVEEKLHAWEHANEKIYFPQELKQPGKIKYFIENGLDLFGRDLKFSFVYKDLDLA